MRARPLSVGLTLSLLAMLAGCAPSGSPGAASRGTAAPPVFATQLAGPATYLGPMPTAVVLLKPDDLNRNRAFCTAFTTSLPTAESALQASSVAPNLVLTRWLVQLPDVPPERTADCDFLVGAYDYARAARLLAALRLSQGQLSGPGPFLVMVIPDNTGLHVAGLDGSAYVPANFPSFIATWGSALRSTQQVVARAPDDPGVVRSLVNLIAAILRAAGGGAAGLIQGVVGGL